MTHPDSVAESAAPSDPPTDKATMWRGSAWSLLTVAIVSVGGFTFWVLAAATSTDADDVGGATAWYTMLQLIVSGSAVGLPILITRRGSATDAKQLTGAAMAIAAGLALLLGLVSPSLASEAWAELSGLRGVQLSPLIGLATVGTALTLGVDARLMSLRRWRAVALRGSVPTIARIPFVFLDPLDDRATWLVILMIGPLALSGFATTAWLIGSRQILLARPAALSSDDRAFFASQHIASLATQAPYFLVPYLVSRQVSGSTNAAFYLVWGIGLMVAIVPQTLSQVLLSETSLSTGDRDQRVKATLGANVVVVSLAWLGSLVLAGPILGLVGPEYANLAPILPWLLLAALAWGVTSICLTEARLAHDSRTTNLITWSLAVTTIVGCSVILPTRPIWGSTLVWLGANLLAMAIGIIALDRRRLVIGSETRTPNLRQRRSTHG